MKMKRKIRDPNMGEPKPRSGAAKRAGFARLLKAAQEADTGRGDDITGLSDEELIKKLSRR
jgi:hypothetical protein